MHRLVRMSSRWWPVMPLLAFFVGAAAYGLDFGHHWDEPWFFIPLRRFAGEGALLPGAYNYPSVSYYLSFAAGLPELFGAWLDGKTGLAIFQALSPHIDTLDFKLRARALFLAVTALTIPSVYGAILASGRGVVVAVVGTLAVVGSFEVAYHARWIAPDGPLLAASAFTTWCLVAAERAEDPDAARRWRYGAAIGAGLSTGTKYTAGLLLLAVIALSIRAALALSPASSTWRTRTRIIAIPCIIFALAYLITTPATILDAPLFLTHIKIQMKTYGGGFGAYTVGAGAEHLGRMLLYLGGTLWSPHPWIAFIVTALTLTGAVRLVQRAPWLAGVVLIFPALFVAYFSIQRTMIVRNLLVILPALAVAFAWGVDTLGDGAARLAGSAGSWGRGGAIAAITLLLTVNVAFVGWAAATVHDRSDAQWINAATTQFINRRGRTERIFLSPRVRARLDANRLMVDTTTVASDADLLVFHTDEGFRTRGEYPAHVWGLTETWFGPYEVNFDRYPTWDGDARILVMTRAMAERVDLALLQPPPR